jgi:hypothetical protein
VKLTELDAIVKGITGSVHEHISELNAAAEAPLQEKITALEKRIVELEQRPVGLKYVGTFQDGKRYEPGQMVTSSGSLWHCNASTMLRPGTATSWTLCAKRGADVKDLR